MRLKLALALGLLASAGWAQDRAVVVTACGTAPGTFAAGEIRPILQNTDGEVCVEGAGGGGGAPTDAPYYVTTANATLSAEVVPSAAVQGLLDDVDAAAMRASIGLTIPGSDTQCIFNDGGALGADAGCVFNKTTDALTVVGALTSGNHVLGSSNSLAWSTDLSLFRGAADTLEQRRGTNAQQFNIYNLYTDAANNESLNFDWDSNIALITTTKAGSGTQRPLVISGSTVTLGYGASPTQAWQVTSVDGSLYAVGNRNIGTNAGSTFSPVNIYSQLTIAAGKDFYTGNATQPGNAYLKSGASAAAALMPVADGVLKLSNWNGDNFVRLNFGGITSSFPALARSAAILQVRLADNSANGALETATLDTDGFTVAGLPAAGIAGRRAYVTDQLTACPATGAAITGGGAVVCPVFDNGTAWISD